MVAASDRDGVIFALSAGNRGDAPEGRALLQQLGPIDWPVYILMDRAYEGDETRTLTLEPGYIPVVPPKSNRKNPWDYDKQLYKQRNQVERLFRRIKRFRRIFTRYDKLDVIFLAFVYFTLIVDALMLTRPRTQSLLEHRGFADAAESVQAPENTSVLLPKLKSNDPANTLIVTSIQKMSRIEEAGSYKASDIAKIRKKRIGAYLAKCCKRSRRYFRMP